MRALGIDLGSRRIGVAVSDPGGILASPVEVVARCGDEARDHRRILEIAEEYEVGRIVVGSAAVPGRLHGARRDGRLAETERLRATTDLPVDTYDERFTTVTADRSLMERNMKADARRRVIDKVAAAVMLQAWLDGQPRPTAESDTHPLLNEHHVVRHRSPRVRPVAPTGPTPRPCPGRRRPGRRASTSTCRPSTATMRRVLYTVGGVLAVVVVLLALGGWWVLRQINPSGGPGDPVTLVVPTGSSTAQIGTLLQDKGVISCAAVFQYYVKFRGAGPFKAGEYDGLYENDSMSNVVTRLKKGPLAPRTRELAIPEGFTLAEIKAKILEVFPEMNAAELDTALATVRSKYQPADSTNLEGLLFPATYQVLESDAVDEQKVVQQMVTKFDQVGDAIGLDQAPARVGLTPVPGGDRGLAHRAGGQGGRATGPRSPASSPTGWPPSSASRSTPRWSTPWGSRARPSTPASSRPIRRTTCARWPACRRRPSPRPVRPRWRRRSTPSPGAWLYYVLANADGSHYFTADYNDFLRAKRVAQQQGLLGG